MDIGESVTVTVPARPRWVDTAVRLEEGGTYRLSAAGQWHDWRIPSGPEGYPSPNRVLRLFEWARRARGEDWFKLMGAVGRDRDTLVAIGAGCTYRPARSGALTCFANDVSLMYWNNKGFVTLTVERTG